jgi:hypothetical protein
MYMLFNIDQIIASPHSDYEQRRLSTNPHFKQGLNVSGYGYFALAEKTSEGLDRHVLEKVKREVADPSTGMSSSLGELFNRSLRI